MSQRNEVGRRSVLKTVGGITAASVLGGTATSSALAAHESERKGVRVNQVGYPKDQQKLALVTSDVADVSGLSEFEVVDAETGESVYSGTLSSSMEDTLGGDLATGHTIKQADFTDLTESGTYKVVAGDHESRPFRIGEPKDVYGELLADVGRLYTLKRANADIQDPETGLDIGPGHMEDQNATIAEPDTSDFLEDYSAGDQIDVTGGWYDAGDYGKYVITTGITAAQMMLAYERNPDAFEVGQFNIPDSLEDPNVGEMPDVLAEVKYGLQFLSKMQRPDGALFYKVAGKEWSGEVKPENDDIGRYVFGLSSAGTAHGVATFAMAARVFRDHDPEFADKMLEQAKQGFQWLQDNPDVVWEKSVDQDGGSGGYGRSDYDAPDRYWAAAELLRTTGDSTYDEYIQNADLSYTPAGASESVSLPANTRAPIDWTDPVSLGHYAYAKSDGSDSDVAATALQKSVWIAQRYQPSHTRAADGYTTGLYAYYWGCVKSGVSRAVQSVWGADVSTVSYISPDADIVQWAFEPLHHALGRSATDYSYVTGYGEKSTENPHDRIVQSTGTLLPGMLVGGPHRDGVSSLQGDSTSEHIGSDTPHALSYVDEHGSYATNEWAINYTAPLFLALAEIPGMRPADGDGDPNPNPGPEVSAPENLSVESTTSSSVTVTWDGVSAAEEYEVTVSDGDDNVVAELATSSTTATVEDLESDTAYTVEVAAVAGDQSAAATVDATTTGGTGGDSTVAIELASSNVSSDGSAAADVVLSDAPAGVSGYEVTVEVADPSVATITGANLEDTPLQTVGSEPSPSSDGSSITVRAADLSESVQDGSEDVELVEVGLQAQSAGETDVSVSVGNLDDDDGEDVAVATTGDTLVVADSLPTVGDAESAPTDPDGDGKYEDLNGNGEIDYDDVVLYFQHRNDPAIADNVDAYDYNGNDDIDFDDVVELFKERSSAE